MLKSGVRETLGTLAECLEHRWHSDQAAMTAGHRYRGEQSGLGTGMESSANARKLDSVAYEVTAVPQLQLHEGAQTE